MQLQLPNRVIDFPRRPLLAGSVNWGNKDRTAEDLLPELSHLVQQGADLIILQGLVMEHLSLLPRMVEEVERARPADDTQISRPILALSSSSMELCQKALPQGFDLLLGYPAEHISEFAALCAAADCAILLSPLSQKSLPELSQALKDAVSRALASGLIMEHLILDSTLQPANDDGSQDRRFMSEIHALHHFQRPVFLDLTGQDSSPPAALAQLAHGVGKGLQVFRVHDVSGSWQALRLLDALERPPQAPSLRKLQKGRGPTPQPDASKSFLL